MNNLAYHKRRRVFEGRSGGIALAIGLLISVPAFAAESEPTTFFTPGNLVVTVEGCGVHGGTCTSVPSGTGASGSYGDNQAAPLTLFQYTPNGTTTTPTTSVAFVNSLMLPQAGSGANFPVSGEYGSSSEGTLQLSGAGQYLTIMGYGIDAPTFDAAYYTGFTTDLYGAAPSGSLAQSGSLKGQSYTAVPRVAALIDANGNVNSSTAVYNVFNTNNPRSIYTADGMTNAYISGQGTGCDSTGGVFYIPLGVTTTAPVAITGADATATTSCLASGGPANVNQDTREVQIYNSKLYVSIDSTEGKSFNRSFIGTLGSSPTTLYVPSPATPYATGPNPLTGFGNTGGTGKVTIGTGSGSIGNNLNAGMTINLSPVNYFFASPSVLYVADSGVPKNDSNGDNNSTGKANIGDGGLQKWVNSQTNGSGTWSLKYTLYQGLSLVNNGNTDGTCGLYGLTGVVNGATVQLYATNYTLNDLDPTYLYGITDTVSNTTPPGTSLAFKLLDTAPANSNFKGVSFAPSIPTGGVEITSVPSGFAFTSAGTGCAPGTYTTPQTLIWTTGSNCALSVVTPTSGAPGVQYVLAKWEDGTTSATHTVSATGSPATYTATFQTQYLLTTSVSPSAAEGSITPATGYVNAATPTNVTATPSAGYVFSGFSGGTLSGTMDPQSVSLTGPASVTASFQSPSAVFQTIDTGTRGDWKGKYGNDGEIIANDSNNPPAYLAVPPGGVFTGAATWTWVQSSTDPRTLQKALSSTDRIGSAFYNNNSDTISLPFSDSQVHQVALYLLDFDTTVRTETITLIDPTSNAVLSTQSFANFHNGTWAIWNVQGPVLIQVGHTGGLNAVVSGLFFSTVSTVAKPTVSITSPTINQPVTGGITLSATAAAANVQGASIVSVQFQLDGSNVGHPLTSGPPYNYQWASPAVANGPHSLVAVATDSYSQTTSSTAVPFTVSNNIPPVALFVRSDTTTEGAWKGHYGSDGEIIALDSNNPPGYALVNFGVAQWYEWATTTDPRALQEANSTTQRIASTYYGNPGFNMDLNLTDGHPHQVAMYFLDWDNGGRSETITILDQFNNVLDTRQISNFTLGQYLLWTMQGHVTVQFSRTAGTNALVNGIFFAPVGP